MDIDIQNLLSLLDKAAAEMIIYGDQSTFTFFDTCEVVGNFIADISNKIKKGNLDEISNLWHVFLPTGIWDDAGGSQEIANEICEILNNDFKPDS